MGSHDIKYTRGHVQGEDFHYGRCVCGQTSGAKPRLQDVQDWARKHEAEIQRIRANSRFGRAPSLESELQHYQQQAADTSLDQHERDNWQVLADELGRRLHPVDRYSGDQELGFDSDD